MKITILLSALLFSFLSVFAQYEGMTFHNLTTSMGLSHGDVTCFCQDYEGFMWIGTADGLNKYDGVEFTVYKNELKDSTFSSNSYINCIYEDKQNNLWIGLSDCLIRYNRDKNNFERIPIIDIHGNKIENSVTEIFEDNNNNLWIGCSFGIFLFDREKKQFTEFFADSFDLNSLLECSSICQDKNGTLWFSFFRSEDIGIIEYNATTKETIRYSTQDSIYKLRENSISCLMPDNKGNIWIGYYSSGIDIINAQTNTIKRYEHNNTLSKNSISSIVQKEDGKIFIGTDGSGLNVFDPNTKSFYQYTASEADNSLISNAIQNIYISREGIVWIGCWGSGVSIYDKRYDSFSHYKSGKNSLQGSSVTCFTEDIEGNIWIATDGGGINKFNPLTKKFTSFRNESDNPNTLTTDKVLALAADNKGGLWAGMWQGGLNYFKIEGENLILKKKYNFVDENNPNSNSIFKIYYSKEKELWVGNFSTGAYKFDPSTEKFNEVKLSSKTEVYNSVRDITCDSYNNLWFASETLGLIKMSQKSGEYEAFTHNEKDSSSLINTMVNVVFEDSKKRLWVGGDESGLNLFNRHNKSFTHYTTDQGLPDNSILGILEDDYGNLWVSSRAGISKASINSINTTKGKPNLTFRNYTIQDGLQDKVFNRWSYFKSSTGEMYFGGLNGFNVFQPDSIKDNLNIPPVHITDFLLFNKSVPIGTKGSPLTKQISETKQLVLNYHQSVFAFRFIALNYIFSEKNQYAYIMEGFEKDWNYVGNKREATYTNLDPGEYTFRVKASNNDGVWNEEGTSISIIIIPPWWQTWWFRLLVVLFIVVMILLFVYLRLRSYRNEQKHLSKLVKLRTLELEQTNTLLIEKNTYIEEKSEELRIKNEQLDELNISKDKFFSIIAHDLKNPFSTIIGLSSVLIDDENGLNKVQQKELTQNIHSSTEKIYNLLENLLMWSSSQLNRIKITPSFYNLTNQIYNVISLFDDYATVKNIKIIFDENKEIIIYADMQMIETVVRNLITNAIKFSADNNNIKIELLEDDDKNICSIADQGIGMTSEQITNLFKLDKVTSTEGTRGERGTGLGLNLCLDFLEKNGGTIWVKSAPGNGSTFYFSVPTQKINE